MFLFFSLLIFTSCEKKRQSSLQTEDKKLEVSKNIVVEASPPDYNAFKTIEDFCKKLSKQDVEAAESYFIEPPKIRDSSLIEMGFVFENENELHNTPINSENAFVKDFYTEKLSSFEILNVEITDNKSRALVKFYQDDTYYVYNILLYRQENKWGIFWFGANLSGIEKWARFSEI